MRSPVGWNGVTPIGFFGLLYEYIGICWGLRILLSMLVAYVGLMAFGFNVISLSALVLGILLPVVLEPVSSSAFV